MKQASDIIVFQRHDVALESFVAAEDRRIAGECRQSVTNHYSDPSGQFHAGIWSGGLGSWKVRYSEHEFCTLLQGRVRVSDEAGHSVELAQGDHFVIPAGFVGTWQVLEPACKTYAVFEPRQPRDRE
ncbi:cupin domain-containing protein [Chromobacterium haemolyticum]|uniref:cupin domain-containing protein n=1 Tax=Chromobacterium haemolyticum TaxID=394935 RepID=UPI002449BFC8|nr:cupin domain-containing protein [Chromobacterium haemolyticum]MDH0342575.1 cupin domain-containing protein [Chromobacterium haemolyticum]